MTKSAIIIVDVQHDFVEGGALAVPGGNEVARRIAEFMAEEQHTLTVMTKDWHKGDGDPNGGHIAIPPQEPDFVDSWPVHCIAGTYGAAFHTEVDDLSRNVPVFSKGYGTPSYSGFEGTSIYEDTLLLDYLRDQHVTSVAVCGLAADYCVKATAEDAVKAGLDTLVLSDLTAGIHKGGEQVAAEIAEMQKARQ